MDVLKNKSTVAVSVSAGVDSMSLLDLSNKWAKNNKKNLVIISFDHNLRRESDADKPYPRSDQHLRTGSDTDKPLQRTDQLLRKDPDAVKPLQCYDQHLWKRV